MTVEVLFLVLASIIGIGFLANYIFRKTSIPDLIWLLVLGLLIGPVFHVFPREIFVDSMPFISALALLMILFEGGLNMDLYKLMKKVPRATVLAVLGFSLSMVSVGLLSWYIFQLDFLTSMLLGTIVGGVSSAIVVPVVSGIEGYREGPKLTLDIESVITDPLCIIVAIVLMDIIVGSSAASDGLTLSPGLTRIVSMFSVSIVLGLVLGMVWLEILQHIKGEKFHYMLTLSFLFLVYGATQALGGNGAIAAFMVGVVLGNGNKIRKMFNIEKKYYGLTEKTKGFQEQISFFIKTLFFVVLGVIITFNRPVLFLYGGLFTAMILLTRYVSVEIASIGSDFSRMERNVMTFMMPRGLAAAVLASMPLLEYGIAGTEIFPEIVFSVILGTALISTGGVFAMQRNVEPAAGEGKTEIEPPEG